MDKPKLTLQQQIAYMKNIKGIGFTLVNEEHALSFLQENNYYFKLKAFAKNYQKYTNTNNPDKIGKYINLEFAYLQELSTLDARLRKIIMEMVLDVEHFLKVQLMQDISDNDAEDGYSIVDEFLKNTGGRVLDEIKQKSKNSYCADLVNKHQEHFAIWSIIEVLSLGDLIELYSYYYSKCADHPHIKTNLLYPIKCLRNAAAHNNCLIHRLTPPYTKEITPNKHLMKIVSQIPDMPKRSYESKMKNPTLHDFVALLEVYHKVVSPATAKHGFESLHHFCGRCRKRKDYFEKNEVLRSNYEFFVKVVDFYAKIG